MKTSSPTIILLKLNAPYQRGTNYALLAVQSPFDREQFNNVKNMRGMKCGKLYK